MTIRLALGKRWHGWDCGHGGSDRAGPDGYEQAFRESAGPFQRGLRVHCYRILGSLADADHLPRARIV